MKNILVRDYLNSLNIFDNNTILDIKISNYTDSVACYNVKYFDIEIAKKRQKLVTITLKEYLKFTKNQIRKQKLNQLKL